MIDFIFKQFVEFINFSIELELLLNIGMQKLVFEQSNLINSFLSLSFWLNIEHFSGLLTAFVFDMFVINEVIVLIDNMLHFLHVFVIVLRVIFCSFTLLLPSFTIFS